MVGWPDASNVLVTANTGTTGGPNGAASSNSHVWFSKPGAPEAYEETAFIRLGVGDGEEITGLCVYAAQLYVFKETKFWVVSPPSTNEHGQPVFSFREVSLGEGTHIKQVLTEKLKETSDRICWASQDGVFFCTTDGVYQTTGSQPSKLSQQLKPLEETVPFEGPMGRIPQRLDRILPLARRGDLRPRQTDLRQALRIPLRLRHPRRSLDVLEDALGLDGDLDGVDGRRF